MHFIPSRKLEAAQEKQRRAMEFSGPTAMQKAAAAGGGGGGGGGQAGTGGAATNSLLSATSVASAMRAGDDVTSDNFHPPAVCSLTVPPVLASQHAAGRRARGRLVSGNSRRFRWLTHGSLSFFVSSRFTAGNCPPSSQAPGRRPPSSSSSSNSNSSSRWAAKWHALPSCQCVICCMASLSPSLMLARSSTTAKRVRRTGSLAPAAHGRRPHPARTPSRGCSAVQLAGLCRHRPPPPRGLGVAARSGAAEERRADARP